MYTQSEVLRQAEGRFQNRKQIREANVKEIKGPKTDWTKIENADRLAQRAMGLGLFEEAGAIRQQPDNVELGQRVFEQIIDANNLLDISFLLEGARMSRAVCRIRIPTTTGTKLGTGFMVSSRVLMTNNHVLESRAEASNATLEFDFYKRENGTTGPIIKFDLQPELFFITNELLDFTIVAVRETGDTGTSVAQRGWFALIEPSGKALVGERVSIIQHPNGDPQKVVVHENQIIDVDFNSHFIHYVSDTMGGSSGSPVLNINWDLVALHHAAVGNNNEGVRISAVVSKIKEILDQESTLILSPDQMQLAQELLQGRSFQPGDDSPNHGGINQGQDLYSPNKDIRGPKINKDGSASWTVPVTLTLGVGGGFNESELSGGDTQSSKMPDPQPSALNDDFAAARNALEESAKKVYYGKAQDQKDITDYYSDMTGMDPNQMYHHLNQLISSTHTTTLSYKKARLEHLYPWIDRRDGRTRELKGIYSNEVFDALEVIRNEVAMEKARESRLREMRFESLQHIDEDFLEALEAAFPYNCEHVVPQSWFNKKKQPKADLHHLFTCEWGCNSFRGNRAYFDFNAEAFRENCGESDHGKFEPKAGKGAVARATLYFLLRYPREVSDSAKEMPVDRIQTIVNWAKNDKVDRWERHRNAEIFKVQGNRNPLIDFPELVEKINFNLGLV